MRQSQFTVASSAGELRQACRVGAGEEAQNIIARYTGESNPLSRFLRAVLAATDDLSGNTALHLCCANGHIDLVRLLLRHQAPIDATNYSGSTPLHYASVTGQLDVVQELLEREAEPVIGNKYGRTALDEAENSKHEDIVACLQARMEELRPQRLEEDDVEEDDVEGNDNL